MTEELAAFRRALRECMDRILAQASREVASWPSWLRTPDTREECLRLRLRDIVIIREGEWRKPLRHSD